MHLEGKIEHSSITQKPRRVLAVDPGDKRLGISISDPSGTIANPLAILEHVSRSIDAATIIQIAVEHGVTLIVVGQLEAHPKRRMTMNCRQRALTALNHQEPDRVPLDFGGRHTTLHLYAHEALMKHLGLRGPTPAIRSYHTYLVEPDPQLLNRFERVTTMFFPKPPSSYEFQIDAETNTYVDEWGTKYYMPPNGYYFDMTDVPLAKDETESDLNKYRWPDPADPSRIAGLPEQANKACEAGEKVFLSLPCFTRLPYR